jgi:NADH:ubiquinone oxidoreductase subunit K
MTTTRQDVINVLWVVMFVLNIATLVISWIFYDGTTFATIILTIASVALALGLTAATLQHFERRKCEALEKTSKMT